ncbi:MAG: type transport system permease protein [Pseudonocardiales bacterium]|jgi:ABC-2 type transport system permease protein|nr:type transport system permease protein [Pseudonocardiales bacterium]
MVAPPTSRATRVRVPRRSVASELRAVRIVWEREVVRFATDRLRIVTALLQPLLFLFVLGTGLSRIASAGTGGLNLRTFLYPGILAMSVLFTAMFSAASIVWDREFGFLREMLVAPVSRASLVLGKCLGGATVATSQGVLVIALAGLVDVPYSPSLILIVFVMQTLLAYTLTAFGVMIAARVKQIQSFMAVTQMLVMPLFFISGAMFPLSGLPTWLTVLNRVDPLTYAVEPMRHAVFDHLHLDPAVRARLDPGVTWGGWQVPPVMCALVVVALGVLLTAVAISEFRKIE